MPSGWRYNDKWGMVMIGMRKWCALSLVLAVAAIATPASGASKLFDFLANGGNAVSPGTPVGTPVTFDVSFTNRDDGNATFNSVGLKGSGGGFVTFTNVVVKSGSNKAGTKSGLGTDTIVVSDLSPIKSLARGGAPLVLTVTAHVSPPLSCSGATILWTPRAWTGSPSSPSNEFTASGDLDTNVTANCAYSVAWDASSPAGPFYRGTATSLVARVTNASTSSANITQITFTPPADILANGSASYLVTGLDIAPGGSAPVNIPASAPCQLADAMTETWSTVVPNFTATGSLLSTSVTGTCRLSFSGLPTSLVSLETYNDIKLTLLDGNNQPIPGFTGTIQLAVTGTGCSISGDLDGIIAQSAVQGVAEFDGVVLVITGGTISCTLEGRTTIDNVSFTTNPPSILVVYQDVIDCALTDDPQFPPDFTAPPARHEFNGSAGVDHPAIEKFYKGVRGKNKNSDCVEVNFTTINNILGSGPLTQYGKTVPANATALFWDEVLQPDATFKVWVTYQDEWTNGNGWVAKRTKVCVKKADGKPADDCTSPANMEAKLKYCLGYRLLQATMPKYDLSDVGDGLNSSAVGNYMPACVLNEFTTAIDPDACTAPASERPNTNSACIRTSTQKIIIQDPITVRD